MICETCIHYVNGKCMKRTNLPGLPAVREFLKPDGKCNYFESRPYVKNQPHGCSSYSLNISVRICELCEAIKRYATESGRHNQIKLWAAEIQYLNEMDRMLHRIEKEKTWVEDKDGTLKEVK